MALPQEYYPTLNAARHGDPLAMNSLLRVCQPELRRYAQRHCLISHIDDAVQETLLVLVRKLHLLHTVAAFSSWLFRIVQRQCRRMGRAFAFDPYEEGRVDSWLADRSIEAIRSDLVQAFDSLPTHYREVNLLRDFAGFTIAEIAEHTQLTAAATKSRLHRARELTREYLLA